MSDPRDDPFWKDDTLVCPVCGGCICHTCSCQAVPVVPNFSQGSMTSTTTTKSTINEVINSMDYNTGYQFSVSGSGVEVIDNNSVSPSTTGVNATINGNSTTWTGVGSRPDFKQSVPGAAFQYTETYMGPGLSNHTIIKEKQSSKAQQKLQASLRSNRSTVLCHTSTRRDSWRCVCYCSARGE